VSKYIKKINKFTNCVRIPAQKVPPIAGSGGEIPPQDAGPTLAENSRWLLTTTFLIHNEAVGVRFELTVAINHNGFQDRPFQPLRHPTMRIFKHRKPHFSRKNREKSVEV